MKIKVTGVTVALGMVLLILLTGCGNLSPVASFTYSPSSGEAPLSVSFDASASSDSDGSITSYVWGFGDGESGAGITASHSYAVSGTYAIQLTVTDDDQSTHSTIRTMYVSPTPVEPDESVIQETTTPEQLWGVFGNSSGSISIVASPRTTSSPSTTQTTITKSDAIGHAKVLVWKYLGEPRYDECTITRASNTIGNVWDVSGRFAYIGSPTRIFDAIIEKEPNGDWQLLAFSWT
ncbi:MAG: PKD domain-containing protein [Nitrospiraceae bacterium]|nr:PKD domain-containing protein [Nitrospiraceae bacterium]